MSNEVKAPAVADMEEDEFEEFPVDTWTVANKNANQTQWGNDWDDVDIDEDFMNTLKTEMSKGDVEMKN